MRGKVPALNKSKRSEGITPAYAGKSDRIAKLSYAMKGSPPPMRGKVLEREQEKKHDRITPAYAGKSFYPLRVTRR